MDMFLPEFAPFTVSLVVMLAIGVVELLSLLNGFSPSSAIESAFPELDVPDLDAPELSGAEVGPLSLILSWLSVGRLPLLALMVIFLCGFGLAGYAVQSVAIGTFGTPLNAWIAVIPALVGAVFATRHLGRWLGAILPRDHSEAASRKDLIGSYATLIRGSAVQGQPAEAKTTDLRGRTHYILLEPAAAGTTYTAGDRVFIVGREKAVYRAVTRLNSKQE